MRAIYIILVGLPCWARLSRWIPRLGLHYLILDDGLASLISVWTLIVMGFGHRPNSRDEGRPLAKYPWPSAVSVESSTVSVSRPSLQKVSASRSLGQVFKGSRPFGPSARLTGHRAARWVPVSPSTSTQQELQHDLKKLHKLEDSKILPHLDYVFVNSVITDFFFFQTKTQSLQLNQLPLQRILLITQLTNFECFIFLKMQKNYWFFFVIFVYKSF